MNTTLHAAVHTVSGDSQKARKRSSGLLIYQKLVASQTSLEETHPVDHLLLCLFRIRLADIAECHVAIVDRLCFIPSRQIIE